MKQNLWNRYYKRIFNFFWSSGSKMCVFSTSAAGSFSLIFFKSCQHGFYKDSQTRCTWNYLSIDTTLHDVCMHLWREILRKLALHWNIFRWKWNFSTCISRPFAPSIAHILHFSMILPSCKSRSLRDLSFCKSCLSSFMPFLHAFRAHACLSRSCMPFALINLAV